MKKKIIAAGALLLILAMALPVLVACSNSSDNDPDTISFYLWNADGLMPAGFEKVLQKYNDEYAAQNDGLKLKFKFEATQDTYKQNLNLYFSAQKTNYDVVFDAQWLLLEKFSTRGYYYDLASYFNNDEYPGLKKAFSTEYIENNKFSGGVYGIPVTESFGDISVTFIRKDWREQCAADTSWTKPASLAQNTAKAADLIDGIDNFYEYEYYIYWVKDHAGSGTIKSDVIPMVCNKDGQYSAYEIISRREPANVLPSDYYKNGIKTEISINSGLIEGEVYIDERSGEAVAANVTNLNPSAPNGKSAFPSGFQTEDTSWQQNYEIVRRWNVDGMMGDVSNETESNNKFKLGMAASVLQSIGNFNEYEEAVKKAEPSAKLEIFVQDADIRNKKEGVQATDYRAWNFLAIPKNVPAEKVPKIMKFFDWLFSSQDNHDLFQYGIKGEHWDEAKDENGNVIQGTVSTVGKQPYTFTAYLLTWNPTYIRLPYASDAKVLEYSRYMYSPERYSPQLYSDFLFSTVGRSSSVSTALDNPGIASMKSNLVAYELGMTKDPVSSYNGYINSLRSDTALQKALAEIQKDLLLQFNEYLAKNK